MNPRTGKHGRLRQLLEILLHDTVTFAELVSGSFLVLLRGLLLNVASGFVSEGSAVAHTLMTVGITEARWGLYLMVCGALQVWLAGSERYAARVAVTFFIFLGFAAMGCAYYVADGARHIPPSVICMTALYILLLARIGEEWWECRNGSTT